MWTRRTWLGGSLGAALVPLAGLADEPRNAQAGGRRFEPDVEIKLVAERGEAAIWDGKKTPVFQYRGQVLGGRMDALRESGSFLGPTFDLVRGERVRVHFENRLPEPTIVHWHGMIVPEAADGHPRLAIKPGKDMGHEEHVSCRP